MRKIRSTHDDYEDTFITHDDGRMIGAVTRDITIPDLWTGHRWSSDQTADYRSYREALRFALG